MPKTLFQEVVFTVIMVFLMVYAMVCYNIALSIGGMSIDVLLMAFHELPIMMLIAFLLEFFFVGKQAKRVAFNHFDPRKGNNPFLLTICISCVTVAFMCPLMSAAAVLLFNQPDPSSFVGMWLQTAAFNFPMALCWQLFYAGPLCRFVFRSVFCRASKKQNACNAPANEASVSV